MADMVEERIRATRRGRGPLALFLAFKLLQPVFFFIALGLFGVGLYENGSYVAHAVWGERVEGEVVEITLSQTSGRQSRIGSVGTYEASPMRFPVVDYVWPPGGGEIAQISSIIPREDLEVGDAVPVRVIPDYPAFARIEPTWVWRGISVAMLIGGGAITLFLVSNWYGIDAAMNRGRTRGGSILAGPFGWLLVLVVVVPAALAAFLRFYWLPWLEIEEYVAFGDRPGRLLDLAEARCGPPASGPVNECELRLLQMPLIGYGASGDALERAMATGDRDRFARYAAAIRDPAIPFSVYWPRMSWSLIERDPWYLETLLATGVAVPADARRDMLERAGRSGREEVAAILARYGVAE